MNKVLLHDVSNSLDAATTALSHPTTVRMRNSHPLSILPRLSGTAPAYYERVEGGQQSRKRFQWKTVTTVVALLFVVVWALGPRERRHRVFSTVSPYPRPGECALLPRDASQ